MKLSLIFPSWFTEFGAFKEAARKVSTFPPLNLCLIAALAKKAGWDVQLIDAHIEALSDEALLSQVRSFDPDLIGLTAATPFFPNALRLAHLFKKTLNKPLMVGGPHVTHYREQALDEAIDYLVIGECDTTFEEFLKQFEKDNMNFSFKHPVLFIVIICIVVFLVGLFHVGNMMR